MKLRAQPLDLDWPVLAGPNDEPPPTADEGCQQIDYLYRRFYNLLAYETARLSRRYGDLEELEAGNIERIVHTIEKGDMTFGYEDIRRRIEAISNHRFTVE